LIFLLQQKIACFQSETPAITFGHGETILLADCNENLLKLGSSLLTKLNYQIDDYQAKQHGIAFCMKPLNLPEFLQTIRQVLDGRSGMVSHKTTGVRNFNIRVSLKRSSE